MQNKFHARKQFVYCSLVYSLKVVLKNLFLVSHILSENGKVKYCVYVKIAFHRRFFLTQFFINKILSNGCLQVRAI